MNNAIMKTTIRSLIALLFSLYGLLPAAAQNQLPPDWQQKTREKYKTLAGKEISLQDFLEIEKAEYFRQQALQKGTATYYQPQPSASICGNGDFETGIDPAEWAGGYGNLNDPTTLTAGFAPGLINLPGTHHTVLPNSSETASTDAITGISVKHGGNKALRLGNTRRATAWR
ncbi:MAG: hypothetical protein IPM81_16510 [Saprospirales bacterium]|nr:hypothetical protein [Saprospirales bacterium]